jgi:purine nucleosidase
MPDSAPVEFDPPSSSPTTDDPRPLLVDTDTASDDAVALLFAALSDRIDLRAVTIVAGNVVFDREVANAKYTLDLADAGDVPVSEGARRPLVKTHDHATEVHGEGGLGGDLSPDPDIESTDEYGPETICRLARENPGDISLLAIGPLTNVAEALRREPALNELLDHVWIMGGNANCAGNVTPAAEYNVWVDPEAAKLVFAELDATLIDWGVTTRDGVLGPDTLARIDALDTDLAAFFTEISGPVRERSLTETGRESAGQPDCLAAAVAAYPELIESAGTYHTDVDERAGLTRGYTLVDERGATDEPARTRVVESVDEVGFRERLLGLFAERNPDERHS